MGNAEQIELSHPNIPCVQKHLTRYTFALGYCQSKIVADVGSGYGWGTEMLSCVASGVAGFELNADVCDIARVRCSELSDVDFFNEDWMSVDLTGFLDGFETIVAFEVFEHIHAPLSEVVRHTYHMLGPQGTLVASLPIMQGSNPHHYAGNMTMRECMEAFRVADTPWDEMHYYYQYFDEPDKSWRNVSIFELTEPFDSVSSGYVLFVGMKPL